MAKRPDHQVVVVGAGAAGLYAALVAAREGARTALVSQAPLATTASYWAQGGVAAALAPDDSPELHLADTLQAGRSMARVSAARILTTEAPAAVEDLRRLGVKFDGGTNSGVPSLGLEGGHSVRRVVHAGGSATGRRITRQLSAQVAEHEHITVFEGASAVGLLLGDGRCAGVVVRQPTGDFQLLVPSVIFATGGIAALWSRSTNPPAAIGTGLTIAFAAGAAVADLELMQFHPTALDSPSRNQGFLITEAIRGEGAILVNDSGARFVNELAPRDEVALAVEAQRQNGSGAPARSVYLDMRMIDPQSFPNVITKLMEAGFDPTHDLIPVAPAAHFAMGGITTDLDGHSTLPGLFAVGECSCTGLHGANRLASNSLAECLVFGRRAALAALNGPHPPRDDLQVIQPDLTNPSPQDREAFWQLAGLERTAEGLQQLAESQFNLARLIAKSALLRTESRGAHRRSDYPNINPEMDHRHTVMSAESAPEFQRWD